MSPYLPPCCFEGPTVSEGGLVLGGSALALETLAALSEGGLVLGGSALALETLAALSQGGLVLAGTSLPEMALYASGLGDLVLGGTASAFSPSGSGSGSGSSPETHGCSTCPGGAAIQYTIDPTGFTVGPECTDCSKLNGPVILTYLSGCLWQGPIVDFCGHGDAVVWTLSVAGANWVVTPPYANLESLRWTAPTAGWSCLTPLVLTQTGFEGFLCHTPPATLTLTPV
jgi:hypothetical protein